MAYYQLTIYAEEPFTDEQLTYFDMNLLAMTEPMRESRSNDLLIIGIDRESAHLLHPTDLEPGDPALDRYKLSDE